MQFSTLKNRLKGFTVFSMMEIKKIDSCFHKQRLSEWQNKGYIKKVRRGYYIFSDLQISEQVLFVIANTIYQPSYISLEMALSLYGLIPESVYGVTSITSLKTINFKTSLGDFIYRSVKPDLMFGYELREISGDGNSGGQKYGLAEMEKAVLDFLYLNPHIKNLADFEGLRFNVLQFKETANMAKFQKYLEAFNSKALSLRVSEFIKFIEYA